ncbi:MAG TPA: LD-carboxypeptidase [Bacteroidales bacterium]|nr:LD-carboxypeptidase [Bacteroidales bacterium]HPS15720.1 LD-carboxypeptidase [Bacteroidales bacterium]
MITPEYLKPGDNIGIIATARKISLEEIKPAIDKFLEWDFNVLLSKNIFAQENQYAGSDAQRLNDIQEMLDNPEIKAIVCARGGYGTVRIIDKINFNSFIKKPKWIVGYSDITVLHSHIHTHYNIETIHATMPLNFPADRSDNEALDSLKKVLTGEKINYSITHQPLSKPGKAEGILVGGNLSLLYALAATPSDINTSGKILFIEDLDEYLYHIDRMMLQLKRSGKLKNLAGLVVGGMTDMKDNTVPFGKTAYEIIHDAVKEYDFPVCIGFPAGHIDDNRALILGRKISLEVKDECSKIIF